MSRDKDQRDDPPQREQTSEATIYVQKTTRGEGEGESVTYHVALDERTLVREGDIEEALRQIRQILDAEMD